MIHLVIEIKQEEMGQYDYAPDHMDAVRDFADVNRALEILRKVRDRRPRGKVDISFDSPKAPQERL